MLNRLGLSGKPLRVPQPFEPSVTHFNFLTSLPGDFDYSRADNAATMRNNAGQLQNAGAHMPRFDHRQDGKPLGLLMEWGATNKCENNNYSPVNLNGISITQGAPLLTIENDSAALQAAGLDQIGGGQVYKLDNTGQGGKRAYLIRGVLRQYKSPLL